MPLVPVNLDWVLGLMFEPRGLSGFAAWEVGTALGAERGAEDIDVMDTELVMILWTGWFDSVPGRASATVCEKRRKNIVNRTSTSLTICSKMKT